MGRAMRIEPEVKRVFAFFDGQNLFYGAKKAYGYPYPNYHPLKLSENVCDYHGWQLDQVNFYTGVPDYEDRPEWNRFWTRKLGAMGKQGIVTFSRPLRYRNRTIVNDKGDVLAVQVGQEKGIDVRIALDVVSFARRKLFDVALIFSQDQDLSEVAREVRAISESQDRWIKIACAYPVSASSINKRGINGTDWIKIDKETYDSCIDHTDYRPKTGKQ